MSGWLKKEEKKIERAVVKEEKALKKEEEKVVFTAYGFKVRKKLFFSVMMGILVAVIGLNKVESLHEVGKHVSPAVVIAALAVCIIFLFLTVIRKNISLYTKQISILFVVLLIGFRILTLKSLYSSNDLIFVASIVTTVASAIYDVL